MPREHGLRRFFRFLGADKALRKERETAMATLVRRWGIVSGGPRACGLHNILRLGHWHGFLFVYRDGLSVLIQGYEEAQPRGVLRLFHHE